MPRNFVYPSFHKYTSLGALVKLYNLEGRYGWFNTSLSDLLSLLVDILSVNNTLPKSTYEAKKKKNHVCLRLAV